MLTGHTPGFKCKGQQASTQERRRTYTCDHHSHVENVTHTLQTNPFCTEATLLSFCAHQRMLHNHECKQASHLCPNTVVVVFVLVSCRRIYTACALSCHFCHILQAGDTSAVGPVQVTHQLLCTRLHTSPRVAGTIGAVRQKDPQPSTAT